MVDRRDTAVALTATIRDVGSSEASAEFGREAAFVAMFDTSAAPVLAYAARRVGAEDAEDVAARVFQVAWRTFTWHDGDRLLWLYSLAHSAVSAHRRRLKSASGSRLESVAQRVSCFHSFAWRDPVLSAFDQLNEEDREHLRLVAWESLAVPAAAGVLGCSPHAFTVRAVRARRRVRRYLTADAGVCDLPSTLDSRPEPRREPQRWPDELIDAALAALNPVGARHFVGAAHSRTGTALLCGLLGHGKGQAEPEKRR